MYETRSALLVNFISLTIAHRLIGSTCRYTEGTCSTRSTSSLSLLYKDIPMLRTIIVTGTNGVHCSNKTSFLTHWCM